MKENWHWHLHFLKGVSIAEDVKIYIGTLVVCELLKHACELLVLLYFRFTSITNLIKFFNCNSPLLPFLLDNLSRRFVQVVMLCFSFAALPIITLSNKRASYLSTEVNSFLFIWGSAWTRIGLFLKDCVLNCVDHLINSIYYNLYTFC